MRKILLALPLLLAMPAAAIELSLEENRAERGNIGFIDMQKVFKLLPDTARARESFEDSVRQAEEQVNLRKAELLKLRAELAQMRADREVLSIAPAPIAPPPAPEPPKPAPKPEPKPEPKPAPKKDFVTPAEIAASSRIASLPGFAGVSTEPLVINIPGASTGPVVVQPPAEQQAPPMTPEELALLGTSTPTASGSEPPPSASGSASPTGTPLELMDKRIAEKEAEIKRKELEYKDHRGKAEKNLLELESRKSEVLLGKIYRAVQEVARKEGVSVVVDKSSILYGHGAVDLTDKVLKQLKGT